MSHAAAGVSVSRCLQLAAYFPEPQKTYGRIPAIRGGERRLDSGGAQGNAPSQLEANSCLAHEGHCMWHVGWGHRAYEHRAPCVRRRGAEAESARTRGLRECVPRREASKTWC
eukprot:scaffold20262_cov115-Isochrysis_galbana.AAC.5